MNGNISDKQLADIEQRCEAATEGPWWVESVFRRGGATVEGNFDNTPKICGIIYLANQASVGSLLRVAEDSTPNQVSCHVNCEGER